MLYKIVLNKIQEVEKEVEICISKFEFQNLNEIYFKVAQLCLD